MRLDLTSNAVDLGFTHALAGTPYALAVANDRLYLGGGFADVDGYPRGNLPPSGWPTGNWTCAGCPGPTTPCTRSQ